MLDTIQVYKYHDNAILPTRAHDIDAGLDLYALTYTTFEVYSQHVVRTGIAINIPPGYVGIIKDRSSLAAKGLHVVGGVIDSGYSGEIKIMLKYTNYSLYDYMITPGDKIAQLLIQKVETPKVILTESLWGS